MLQNMSNVININCTTAGNRNKTNAFQKGSASVLAVTKCLLLASEVSALWSHGSIVSGPLLGSNIIRRAWGERACLLYDNYHSSDCDINIYDRLMCLIFD